MQRRPRRLQRRPSTLYQRPSGPRPFTCRWEHVRRAEAAGRRRGADPGHGRAVGQRRLHRARRGDCGLGRGFCADDEPRGGASRHEEYPLNEFHYNNITQPNRNRLLWLDPTVDGVKTGHTEAAGFCLIASSRRGGRRLLSVLLGSTSEATRAQESQQPLVAPVAQGQRVGTLRVTHDGRPVGEYPVVALEPVAVAGIFGRAWDTLRLWFK